MDALFLNLVILAVAVAVPVAISILLYNLLRMFILRKSRNDVLPAIYSLASIVMRENGGETNSKRKIIDDYLSAKGGDGHDYGAEKAADDYWGCCKIILLSVKDYEERLDILRFLFSVAYADGIQPGNGLPLMKNVATQLHIDAWDYSVAECAWNGGRIDEESNLYMKDSFLRKRNEACLTLGESPDCSEDSLASAFAYWKKRNDNGEMPGNDSDEKNRRFRQISEAYDFLLKCRSMNSK